MAISNVTTSILQWGCASVSESSPRSFDEFGAEVNPAATN